jgi:uncharacterized protein (DUF433 family)
MVIDSTRQDYERLTRSLYTYADADRIAGVTRGTSSRWLKGYMSQDEEGAQTRRPPITPTARSEEAVSFIDLIEVIAIGRLRERGLSMPKIRGLVRYCQEMLRMRRPLATERFKTDGRDIFIEAGQGRLLDVGRGGGQQVWDEVLDPFLKTIDYHHEFAWRWWPLGKDVDVVVDPDYGFGLPVIEGSGVRTETIAERHRAGDTKEEIAYDFGVKVPQVEDALRYEIPEAA